MRERERRGRRAGLARALEQFPWAGSAAQGFERVRKGSSSRRECWGKNQETRTSRPTKQRPRLETTTEGP